MSSSRTVGRLLGFIGVLLIEEELLEIWRVFSEFEYGDGDERWRGECPGESSMMI